MIRENLAHVCASIYGNFILKIALIKISGPNISAPRRILHLHYFYFNAWQSKFDPHDNRKWKKGQSHITWVTLLAKEMKFSAKKKKSCIYFLKVRNASYY